MKKDNLPNPLNLKRTDRLRLEEKTKLEDEVIDSLQRSNITEGNKFVKCRALVITQLLEIKEKKQERRTILKEQKKLNNYSELRWEKKKIWNLSHIVVVPVVTS